MTSMTSTTSVTSSANAVDDCPNPDKEKHSIHWFRKGLRLHDNPALLEAVKNATTFRCIYIIDPWFAGATNVGINKWRFLLQSLEDLDSSLRKLGSRLYVIRGQPPKVLPSLFEEWNITHLTFEEDPEPHGKEKDKRVKQQAGEKNVKVIIKTSHTLYNLDEIFAKNGGSAPLTYKRFQTIAAAIGPPVTPVATLTKELIGTAKCPFGDDHDEKYGVPSLQDLDFDSETTTSPTYLGGETVALSRLDRHLERKAWVASFERPKMTTQSLFANQYCVSPYLRFGCLSSRLFYWKLAELYKKVKKEKAPITLFGQLLWREFFYVAATRNPNFDQMKGNDICIKIPWDDNPKALAKWAEGMTGFPWIDAIMVQLKKEGWIHHLARHAIGCFLTRGNLWLSWEEGMKVFDEYMLDADWSVNAGSWMWMSCSSFFQQFFHCYCPVGFGKRCDPNGDFVRHYLPVLKGYPAKYIFEPWTAPIDVQRAAKCIIGKNYPPPMCNHAEVARINMERMKLVYHQISRCSRVSLLPNMKGDKDKKDKQEAEKSMRSSKHGCEPEANSNPRFTNFKMPAASPIPSPSHLPSTSSLTSTTIPVTTLPTSLPVLLVSRSTPGGSCNGRPASSVLSAPAVQGVQSVSPSQLMPGHPAALLILPGQLQEIPVQQTPQALHHHRHPYHQQQQHSTALDSRQAASAAPSASRASAVASTTTADVTISSSTGASTSELPAEGPAKEIAEATAKDSKSTTDDTMVAVESLISLGSSVVEEEDADKTLQS